MKQTAKRRLLICIAIIVGLVCVTVSCSSGVNTGKTKKDGITTLKMAAWSEVSYLDELLELYNSTHTDSQIEMVTFYDPPQGFGGS